MISIVACCHGAKLCAYAALDFRSQQHRCLHEMTFGLPFCYYYKFKGPRSGSDEASKECCSQNEVDKAMGPRNKLAKVTGGFLSIFKCCKLNDGTLDPRYRQ